MGLMSEGKSGPSPTKLRAIWRREAGHRDQNGARTALTWLDGVRVAARITEEAGQTVCPHCGSTDVHPPISDLTSTCVDCGESWGDITRPDLLNPHFTLT